MPGQLIPIEAHERTVGQIFDDAYSPQWDAFLAGGKVSYFVLGSADRDGAFAVPHEVIYKLLKHLRRTPERHWHVALEENAAGQIDLVIPKTGSRIGLAEFEIGAS